MLWEKQTNRIIQGLKESRGRDTFRWVLGKNFLRGDILAKIKRGVNDEF